VGSGRVGSDLCRAGFCVGLGWDGMDWFDFVLVFVLCRVGSG
jgi:hypothetical protein